MSRAGSTNLLKLYLYSFCVVVIFSSINIQYLKGKYISAPAAPVYVCHAKGIPSGICNRVNWRALVKD